MILALIKPKIWCLLLLILLIHPSQMVVGQTISRDVFLNDSISQQIKLAKSDTTMMYGLLKSIRRHRRSLKKYYKPLLVIYVGLSKDVGYRYGEMKSLDILGLQERYDENYDKSISLHNESLQIALQLKDSSQLCYNYNNLGQAYRKQDLNELAIKYFYLALEMYEHKGMTRQASYTHNTLGATYFAQDEYDKSAYHLNVSLNLAIDNKDKRTMSYNYGSLGEIMLKQNKGDEALAYFKKALKIKEELNYDKGMAVTYHLMGEAWFMKKNYPVSILWFQKAIKIHEKYNTQRYLSHCYAFLGKISLAKNELNNSTKYLDKADQCAENVHSIENLILIGDAKVELLGKQNRWEKAMQIMANTNSLRDSIRMARYQKEIQTLEIGYQTEQKEQQIEILSAENQIKNQRLRLGIAIIVILVLGLAFAYSVIVSRKRTTKLKEEKLQQQLLKSQMNPHFIFNALASIQNYMYRNDPKKAARFMGNFASLARSILNNSSADYISLEEEINTLQNYLELEQMRGNGSFSYSLNYDDDLETEFIQIPPMLLQPFIENAIKHGVKDMDSGGLIELNILDKEDLLYVEVEDNGVGIKSSENRKNNGHVSMATSIFKQRISILKSNYPNLPEPEMIDLSNEGGRGTLVKVYLPILNE
ncbi:tetratricopeptide repeat-containing sensor histidine kinase [Labilibacter marinus]|uniref:tetratricopeptide repeat-containing sensor histidine kinase n=1 Tax=Labilibacter marinus TaxID=1477105 RepID=UPI000835C8A8|nr:tetratricopeptide repeat protein [Labilibacter marinus]